MRSDDVPGGWPSTFGTDADDRACVLALTGLQGITPGRLRRLAWEAGSAAGCVSAIRGGRAGSDRDRRRLDRWPPAEIADTLTTSGARLVVAGDPEYPEELADLQHDPPGWLFVRGGDVAPGRRRVAIVGARSASPLGREIAFDLGRRLAGAGLCVVSGAATGIDGSSHRGALSAPGHTVAVLGSGIDIAYPRSNASLIEQIAHHGTLISEYPPGMPALPYNFPARNRIIVALAEALVVVEGAGRSGSRISVDHALDLGRDVFAVPGPVTSPLSEVPLALLREGATPIRGADDLLADLGVAAEPAPGAIDLPDAERAVLEVLAAPSTTDDVIGRSGLTTGQVAAAIIGLELRGLVRLVGGRYQRRLGAT
jgi:DNA processing protein